MKLNEIVGKPKATSAQELLYSIKETGFTKDGSDLKITGDFKCWGHSLTSLVGCPRKIGGNFSCANNNITSLEGCPEEVGADVSLSSNHLTSLEGIHKRLKKMNGVLFANNNPIASHVLGVLKIPGCETLRIGNKKVEKIINKYLPLGDLLDCQEELIEAGFEEYAQL